MRCRHASLGVVLAAALLSGEGLGAQEVRGRVVDAATDRPVTGAMIVALDAAGDVRARTLTDEVGAFVLTLPPGLQVDRYQVVRIGYGTQTFAVDALSAARASDLRIESSPIEIEGVGVVAENLCGDALAGGGIAYEAWLEVRKALEMTRLTQSNRSLSFETEMITRVLDPGDLAERQRDVSARRMRGETPYYSLTEEQMTLAGWITLDDDGSLRYWAPDATALLSSAFQEQHCFGAELGDAEIVVRFTPNTRRPKPDIQGEVILDRETYHLRALRYEYTSLPLPSEADGLATGQVRFASAPNGGWMVTDWWIRMPVVRESWRGAVHEARVLELREEGGQVLRIDTGTEVIQLGERPPA
jgi:hypothetical protein